MAINFPDSPATNDSFTSGGKKWIFDGTTWGLITANSYTISTGEVTAAKIASNAVTEAKINAGAVTQAKLASGLSGITVTTTENRSAVIPSPFTGQFIFLTDTSQLQRWDGSTWVVAITTVPTGAPTSVAVSGSPLSGSVTLTFSAGADGGSAITNYQYALSTNGGTTYGEYTALSPADASSPITITGLAVGTAYNVKLKAVNALGAGSSESSAVSFTTAALSFEYLVIAGGGGGGSQVNSTNNGGGGGAGGYRTNVSGETSGGGASAEAAMTLALGTYTVTVGSGGAVDTIGGNSVFNSITSTGGGKGGGLGNNVGGAGGSGGGGSAGTGMAGGAGTTGQGYGGATGNGGGAYIGGGGGGAGAAGNGVTAGGTGLSSSINGTATTRAGGGGGGGNSGSFGAGGSGGGGRGGTNTGGSVAGTANTGGGGGGSGNNVDPANAGGSGVVIVRYLTANLSDRTITGGTATTSGSYTVRTFTATGSLVIA
jgi:hypothetical protein